MVSSIRWFPLFAVACVWGGACGGCRWLGVSGGGDGGTVNPGDVTSLTIQPADDVVTVTAGGSPAVVAYTAIATGPKGTSDVTGQSLFSIDDFGLGTLSGSQFVS